MKLEIDILQLNKYGLTITGYLICYCLYSNRKDILLDYIKTHDKFDIEEIKTLEEQEWIRLIKKDEKITFENLQIQEKFSIFVENKTIEEKDWISDWFNIFPQRIKSGGYYVKSDINGCRKKMKKFMSIYPEYDKDIIMKATTNYVKHCEYKGYQYMKIAPYFIEKDGISMLAGECEAIINNSDDYNNDNIKQI